MTNKTKSTTRKSRATKKAVVDQNMSVAAEQMEQDIDALLAAEFAELEDEVNGDFMEPGEDEMTLDDEVMEMAAEPVEEEALTDTVAELEMEEAKAEAYAEQEPSEGDMSTEPVEKKAAKVKGGGGPRKTMAGYKKSEVVKDKLGEKLGDILVLELSDADLGEEALKAKQTEVLSAIDKMAKKVGEKAVNMTSYLSGRAKLSAYTEIAIRLLVEKGEITTKDLIEHLNSGDAGKPYSIGTSRSQTHQMFSLLPQMKVGIMDGKVMKVNEDSAIVAKFRAEMA